MFSASMWLHWCCVGKTTVTVCKGESEGKREKCQEGGERHSNFVKTFKKL
jgi:hypothetical protein